MGHINLGLYSITYNKAKEILSRTRKGNKWIANNTKLYEAKSDRGNGTRYIIKLHSTDIIELYDDGAVKLSLGNYNASPTTRNRMNNYPPRHLEIVWGRRGRVGTIPDMVLVKLDKYVHRPLGSSRLFYADGTAQEAYTMNELDAKEVWGKVEDFAMKFAQKVLYGKMWNPYDARAIHKEYNKENMDEALQELDNIEGMTSQTLANILDDYAPYQEPLTKFYKENYLRYAPTPPTKGVDLADWMERRILDPKSFRPEPGTKEHKTVRQQIQTAVCCYFKARLGF